MAYKTLGKRIVRHAKALGSLTPARVINLAILVAEMKLRRAKVTSGPIFCRINPCSVCNLACPGCAIYDDKMGSKKYLRPKGMMPLETYRRIIDALAGTLLQVVLYDEGEPLLNERIWEMVRYAHQRRIRTVISSNLSFPLSDAYLQEMFDAGLDHLIVALDGMTQETYERHRQGGRVALVKHNFERMMAFKAREPARNRTEIEVQFIEFDHNLHEKPDVVAYAERLGADAVSSFAHYAEELADRAGLKGRPRKSFGCFDAYAIADFDVDGSLYPCDFQEDSDAESLGNIRDVPFRELWNSERMVALRRAFSSASSAPLDRHCEACPVTRALPRPLA